MKARLWLLFALLPLMASAANPPYVPPSAILLNNATATGPWVYWPGGIGAMTVYANTWSTATITLQYWDSVSSQAIVAGASCIFTSSTTYTNCNFYIGQGYIQAAVSGGGSPAGLYAQANIVQKD